MRLSSVGVILVAILLVAGGCTDHSSKLYDHLITQEYPALYEVIYSREYEKIIPFTDHASPVIRRQAWRGLVQTPVDSMQAFIQKVKQDSSQIAWFALSLHPLKASRLRGLGKYWLTHPSQRAGASKVLGRQGDGQTLAFLLEHVNEIPGSGYEQEAALAIGRLMLGDSVRTRSHPAIIKADFSAEAPQTVQSWLYGYYRGSGDSLGTEIKALIKNQWQAYGLGSSAKVDQYVAGILGPSVFSEIVNHYDAAGTLDREVQLSVELARTLAKAELAAQNKEAIKKLLLHPNPHVVQQTLVSLSGKLSAGDSLAKFIKREIIEPQQTAPLPWLQAVATVSVVDPGLVKTNAERLRKISGSHPYLFPRVLHIWMQQESGEAFLNRIETIVTQGSRLKALYGIRALTDFWPSTEDKQKLKPQARQIIFKALALHDRGVTFASQALLSDSLLFDDEDFNRINHLLTYFELPGDIEVYQAFGRLYKQQFEQQAATVIDSLAALGYAPLNRSLKQAGWEQVEVAEGYKPEFKTPNWERLAELGKHPVWVLETEKGTVRIKMNPLSAPATVSAIDSLTRAGVYDGVPFHRVVPNFVIQGGDFKRGDGFGGPDFIIPTEPSEGGFVRGAVGIASAGTDTEGSQYFIMHQWSPHLNGRYTLFGHVVEGMEVVDRIVEGDKVLKAHWE